MRARLLVVPVLLVVGSVVAGCGSASTASPVGLAAQQAQFQDNYEAPVSAAQCVVAWNKGSLVTDGGGQQWDPNRVLERPTQIGQLSPRVYLHRCNIAFDLGHGLVYAAFGNGVRYSSDALKGLYFYPDPMNGTTGILPRSLVVPGNLTTPWNACQSPDGRIQQGACPDASASLHPYDPAPSLLHQSLERFRHDELNDTPTWWLGLSFRGEPANPTSTPYGVYIDPAPREINYLVGNARQAWMIAVFTLDANVTSVDLCGHAWRTFGCSHGKPDRSILAIIHPQPGRTVVIMSWSQVVAQPITFSNSPPPATIVAITKAVTALPRNAQDHNRCVTCP